MRLRKSAEDPLAAALSLPAGAGSLHAARPAAGASASGPAGEPRRRGGARSLFGEILDWMFAPLLLLWPMSVTLTYLVAHSIASGPYDQALVERAEVLAEHVRFDAGAPRFDLSAGLMEMLGNGVGDAGAYLVADADGRVLAGDAGLPRPHEAEGAAEEDPDPRGSGAAFRLRDDSLRGHAVRVAYGWLEAPGGGPAAVLVEAAEPPAERTQLANEIVKGVILPQFVVLPLALLLVWFGLSRGLAPLARLQHTIRHRPPEDLSPINADAAPEELTPLLGSFNELLLRMAHNLQVQKRFIADAAHQMKTPLAGLRTQAELAQREVDPIELQRSLRQIAASTERATRLVNQLLALARAEHAAGESVAFERIDLDRLARSVVQQWVPAAVAQGIDLGFEGADGDCRILGAPMLLRELLNNLIENAVNYGCATGDAADGAITVRVRRDGAAVLLEVEDNGPGVAPEERARVFERFYRILGTHSDGSGLGLAIVREISAHHDATVELADARTDVERAAKASERGPGAGARGPGARFTVRFAAAPAPGPG